MTPIGRILKAAHQGAATGAKADVYDCLALVMHMIWLQEEIITGGFAESVTLGCIDQQFAVPDTCVENFINQYHLMRAADVSVGL